VLHLAGPYGVLFFFLSLVSFFSGYPFLLAFMLDLLCYRSGVYGKSFPAVSCFPIVFQSSLCLCQGWGRILQKRYVVGSIPEGAGMMAFSMAPVV